MSSGYDLCPRYMVSDECDLVSKAKVNKLPTSCMDGSINVLFMCGRNVAGPLVQVGITNKLIGSINSALSSLFSACGDGSGLGGEASLE